MKQAGLDTGCLCWLPRYIHSLSKLDEHNDDNVENRIERSSSTDSEDVPVEISNFDSIEANNVWKRVWHKFKVFEEFHLVLFMLVFGLLAMFVGTYTTIAGALS